MKILVVDDDPMTAQALSAVLTHQNYVVEVACDGIEGWELIDAYDYDLVLLDVMLPRLDGVSLCRQIREKGLQIPILLLTGLDGGQDKALGLDAGADDYVVKPFEEKELIARVRALLRRAGGSSNPIMEWRDLRLDPSLYEVTYGANCLSLTPKEYGLVELFLRNSRRVFSCGMILEHLWAYEEMPGEEAVRTHIKGLRQKLKAAGAPNDLIETVYGIGYRLNPTKDLQSVTPSNKSDSQKVEIAPVMPKDLKKQQAAVMIQAVWHEFKDSVYAKVAVLAQVKEQVLNHNFNDTLKQTARQNAHVLAGSLGSFGLHQGSAIARQLEQALLSDQVLSVEQAQWFETLVQTLELEIESQPTAFAQYSVESIEQSGENLEEQGERSQPKIVEVDGDPLILEPIRFTERMLQQSGLEPTANSNLTVETPEMKGSPLTPSNMTLEQSLTRQIQQQSAIAQLGLAILKGSDLASVMSDIMASIGQSLAVELCCVLKHLKSKQAFLVKDGIGWPAGIIGTMVMSAQHSQGQFTLQAGEPVLSEHLATENRFEAPHWILDAGAISSLSVPILDGVQAYGVLVVYTQTRYGFGQDEIDFLIAIAQLIAGAHNQDKMRSSLAQLRQILDRHSGSRNFQPRLYPISPF